MIYLGIVSIEVSHYQLYTRHIFSSQNFVVMGRFEHDENLSYRKMFVGPLAIRLLVIRFYGIYLSEGI